MAITDKAKAAIARLNKVKEARDGVDEAKELESFRGQLLQLAAPICLFASNAKFLANQGVGLSPVTEIGSAIETVKKVFTRFVENPKSTTLKQGAHWKNLAKKLESLASTLREVQANDWKTFFGNSFFGGLPPSQREAKLAPTPENKESLARYKILYQNFNKYRSNLPKDADDFKSLQMISEQLAQIKFQEDVPDDVRKFFEATNTGAGLDLLTIDVIEWLRSNNLLSSYVVRAKLN